jgi:Xaa-Pro aminopeptidase
VPKAVPGSAECPFISATSPGVVQPGMVLAFECPWSVTGLGGFIVENRLPLTEDGIRQINRLPDRPVELR